MPRFKVHVFEEVRMSYEVEADSMQDAVDRLVANFDSHVAFEMEATGDYSNDVCVDPILEDGTVDLINYQWLKIEKDSV